MSPLWQQYRASGARPGIPVSLGVDSQLLTSTQRCLKVPKGAKKHPEVLKSTLRCSKVPKGIQNYPTVLKRTKRYLKIPRGAQKYQEVLKSTKRDSNIPRGAYTANKVHALDGESTRLQKGLGSSLISPELDLPPKSDASSVSSLVGQLQCTRRKAVFGRQYNRQALDRVQQLRASLRPVFL